MNFKKYKRKENISITFCIISGLLISVSLVLVYLEKIVLGLLVAVISSIIFFTFLKLSDYFSKKAIHEKLNYYLNKDKYTEVFFNKKFYSNSLEEKMILLLIEKSDINFFAKLEGKTILIKAIKHGKEISCITMRNFSQFLSCFIFEKNN